MNYKMQGGVLFSFLIFITCGCSQSMRVTDEMKQSSLERVQEQTIDGVDFSTFASTRSAVLFTGTDEATNVRIEKNDVQGHFRLNGEECRLIGGCVTVPIDARGYWLTASHCIDSGAALIYLQTVDGHSETVPVQIVWVGDRPGQDIALLYAPLCENTVPVKMSNEVRVGAQVICVGSGIGTQALSAGSVIGVGGSTDRSLVWLEHNAPLSFGDSGGPAFYTDGILAGINVQAGTSLKTKSSKSTAIQPSIAQIKKLIEDDWNNRDH